MADNQTTPPAWSNGRCRTCGKPVRWAKFPGSGKFLCVEPAEREKGNMVLGQDGNGADIIRQTTPGLGDWQTHVITCKGGKPGKAPPERKTLFE